MKNGFILLALTLLLSGCKTKYVVVPETHEKDSVITRWQHDSIVWHDSVYIKEYAQGDTVYQIRERTKMMYRNIATRDTVQVATRDTVAKPVIVEKKVVEYKYITHWYDRICRMFTCAVLLFLVACVVVWLVKKKMGR